MCSARTIEAEFGPHEIKTFVLRGRGRESRRTCSSCELARGDDWQLKGWLGEEWRWHVNKPWDMPGWLPARVPGSVLDDLARAGEVPDLYSSRNSRLGEWAAERTWVYRRRVDGAGPSVRRRRPRGDRLRRRDEVARHEGAFTPFEVEVPPGEHLLAVAVQRAPESEPQVGRTRGAVHKSRMGYGWDFCPRLVHQGIWRPVTLDAPPERFPVVTLEDDIGTVEVDGEVVLRVDAPELWWPNGMGEQRLYDVEAGGVASRSASATSRSTTTSSRQRCHGAGAGLELGAARCALRRAAAGEARAPARLAARANVNLIRVWGGGLIEDARVLRALRPPRPARLAGVRPVELRDRSTPSDDPSSSRRWSGMHGRSSRGCRATRRSRSGAAATSSTATTRRPCSRR